MFNIIAEAQREQLIANGQASRITDDFDPFPVIKLFTPDAGSTWLLSELDETGEMGFGLCDPGLGSPELGQVSLHVLAAVRGMMNMPIEQDLHFRAEKRLSLYAREARAAGRIQA